MENAETNEGVEELQEQLHGVAADADQEVGVRVDDEAEVHDVPGPFNRNLNEEEENDNDETKKKQVDFPDDVWGVILSYLPMDEAYGIKGSMYQRMDKEAGHRLLKFLNNEIPPYKMVPASHFFFRTFGTNEPTNATGRILARVIDFNLLGCGAA
eukprot:g18698.t1